MLTVKKFLSINSIDFEKENVKLIRHKHGGYDLSQLYKNNKKLFCLYQSFQARPVFNCDYIISFIGADNTRAKFAGVFKNSGQFKAKDHWPKLKSYLPEYDSLFVGSEYFYSLEELEGYDDFKERLIISWGNGARSWAQTVDKEITEILPKGYVKEFPGFMDFTLDFGELEEIVNNPESNREWQALLSSVAGVYLILDKNTGYQYIGSAYGSGGIWNRWNQYVQSKHGGNQRLIELHKSDGDCYKKFQFTILQTLPRTLTAREVIDYERKYKQKLGSRAFGLNCN